MNKTAMQTLYPSNPSIVNGLGLGGSGAGFGHDCSQSTQAHGSVLSWLMKIKKRYS